MNEAVVGHMVTFPTNTQRKIQLDLQSTDEKKTLSTYDCAPFSTKFYDKLRAVEDNMAGFGRKGSDLLPTGARSERIERLTVLLDRDAECDADEPPENPPLL
eukprot:Opistho-2@64622